MTFQPHTPEFRQAFCAEARSWLGTKFFPRARQKGGAVDCVNLVVAIYQRFDLLNPFHPPFYQIDDGKRLKESLLETTIAGTGQFYAVWDSWLHELKCITGDLLCFQSSRVTHHCGVLTSGTQFIHATENNGVIESDLEDETMRRRLRKVFRPLWPEAIPWKEPAPNPDTTNRITGSNVRLGTEMPVAWPALSA